MIGSDTALFAAAFGLGAGIAWGLGDYFGAIAARSEDPVRAAAAVQCVGALAFVATYALALGPREDLELMGVGYAAAGGVLSALGLAALYTALDAGPVAVVSALGSAYPLVTTLLAVVVFAARPSTLQLVGVGLVVVGVIACSGIAGSHRAEGWLTAGIKFGAAALLLWGVAFALLDQGVDRLGWQTSTLVQVLAAAGTCLAVVLRDGTTLADLGRLMTGRYVAMVGLLLLAGDVFVNVGLTSSAVAGVAIVTAVSSSHAALTMVLALGRFREQVGVVALCGAAVSIVGVVTLGVA